MNGSNLIEENRQRCFDGRRLRRFERTQHPLSDTRHHRLQGDDEVAQKAEGSPSPSSSDSQATRNSGSRRPRPATHSLTKVVFPKPAGAETRISL